MLAIRPLMSADAGQVLSLTSVPGRTSLRLTALNLPGFKRYRNAPRYLVVQIRKCSSIPA